MYMYRAPVLCKLLCRGYAAEGTRRQTLYYVNYYVAGTRRTVTWQLLHISPAAGAWQLLHTAPGLLRLQRGWYGTASGMPDC